MIGIVSLNDLVRGIARLRRGQDELIETIAAVCAPREKDSVSA